MKKSIPRLPDENPPPYTCSECWFYESQTIEHGACFRLDAPFPSQIAHGHSTIRELQNADGSKLALVRCGCPVCNRDATDCANWPVFDGEIA